MGSDHGRLAATSQVEVANSGIASPYAALIQLQPNTYTVESIASRVGSPATP